MDLNITLGIDIGGSHITCALINTESNMVIRDSKVRMDVDSQGSANHIVESWLKAINQSLAYTTTNCDQTVGISMPGPFQYDVGICLMKGQDKFDSLYGINVKNLLAEKLNIDAENIRFINDAASFLWGEVLSGAAKNTKHSIGLTLGTGLGSARFSNTFVEDADLWNCKFKDSIAEEYLSTRWFVNRYYELSGVKIHNVKDLVKYVVDKEQNAIDVFKEFGRNLGLFLVQFIQTEENVEVVVLGGNIAKSFHLFTNEMERCLKQHNIHVEVKQAELGEDAALIGAAGEWKASSAG